MTNATCDPRADEMDEAEYEEWLLAREDEPEDEYDWIDAECEAFDARCAAGDHYMTRMAEDGVRRCVWCDTEVVL